jgi:hypothetical protein
LYVSHGIVRATEVCIDQCKSDAPKSGNAVTATKITSIALNFVTVSRSSGSGFQTVRITEPDECSISNTNVSSNTVPAQTGIASGLSIRGSEVGERVTIKFLNIERSVGGSLIVLNSNPGLEGQICNSIFRGNSPGAFSFSEPVIFHESYLLDSEFTVLEASTSQSVVFEKCRFAIVSEPTIKGVTFQKCQFSVNKAPKIALLNIEPCVSDFTGLPEGSQLTTCFFLTVTATILLVVVYYLWTGLRYDLRRLIKFGAIGTGLLSGLLLCFWIGGFGGFFVFVVEIGGFGYFFYRYPSYLGVQNAERLETFLKGAKVHIGQAVDSGLGLGRAPQVFPDVTETNPIPDLDPKDPVPFG